jgi:hypothetical protein
MTPDVTTLLYHPVRMGLKTKQEAPMKSFFAVVSFCLIFCAVAFPQEQGVIQCNEGSRIPVPAWTAPGSAQVVEQLSCGQIVSISGLDRGYFRIAIGDRIGYVYAKYVRLIQGQNEQDRRIADLEAQVKGLKQQEPAPSTRAETPAAPESPGIIGTQESHTYGVQEHPKVEIFGGYTFVHLDGGAGNMDGWNASVLGNINSIFGIKGEFSGLYGKDTFNDDIRFSGYSFMGGPQVTGRTDSVNVFAHALFGVEHLGASTPFGDFRVGASINAFAMAFGGGLDWHQGNWGIRLPQVDYFPWRALGGTGHNIRISGGIVLRFD